MTPLTRIDRAIAYGLLALGALLLVAVLWAACDAPGYVNNLSFREHLEQRQP